MSLSAVGSFLQAFTYTTIPLKYLPATVWFWYTFASTLFTNQWTTPLEVVVNMETIVVTLLQSWGVCLAALLLAPIDWWIQYDFFGITVVDKTTGGPKVKMVRDASWSILTYALVMTGLYSGYAIAADLLVGTFTTLEARAIVQLVTALLGLMTSLSYFFTVQTYAPYL